MQNKATSKRSTRRSFLAGVGGAALSLPWLESMAGAAAADTPAVRLAFFYLPNGLVRRGFFPGESDRELPKFASQNNVWRYEGKAAPIGSHPLTFTPTLAPLHDMKEKVALITGMDRTFQNGTDSHAQAASCFLTSSAPYTVPNSVYPLARTLDHVAADEIGQATPFTTLELSCNDAKDNIESIYFDNMSWYGPGHVAPSMRNPRQVYDRLFSTKANTRYRNITDLVLGNARNLQKKLAKADQQKFGEYFEAIRSIETRMDRMDALRSAISKYQPERPRDHFPRDEYIHIMGDLLVTALQAGLTNVGTLMVAPERWTTTNKYEGILDQPRSHHAMTHSQSQFIDDLLKLDRFHIAAFTRLLAKMDRIEEAGATTLLDNTIFTLGAGLGDGATHQYNDLPVVVAGGGGGKLKLGRHIHCEKGTPLANLWLTQLHALGIESKSFADSTSPLSSILAAA
jgi:predicted nucleic acid-binding OB-fold protein